MELVNFRVEIAEIYVREREETTNNNSYDLLTLLLHVVAVA